MFLCEVREFGVPGRFAIVNGHLYRQDRYFFYDENLHPIHPFYKNTYDIFYVEDGAWIENIDAEGKITAKHLSFNGWKIDLIKNHRYCADCVTINGKIFYVDGKRKDKKIVSYIDNKEVTTINVPRIDYSLKSHNDYVYGYSIKTVYCFDSELKAVWTAELDAEIFSIYVGLSISDEKNAVLLVYFGSDSTSYGFRAYQWDTGVLLWERKIDAKASGIQSTKGKLYFCYKGIFIRLNALTGEPEVNQQLSYENADGSHCPIITVVPIKSGILCFYKQSKFIEVRADDAKCLIQKIVLPETLFVFPSEPRIFEYSGRYYFGLEQQVMWLNPMKSAQAVLTLDNSAPANCEAKFESRPPYAVESIKDARGKNGFHVRMGGEDSDKIIRYANIVLKELAYMNGKTSEIEFESRDHDNAGFIVVEIDTSSLPDNKPLSEWAEIFSVIKNRTEDELTTSEVKAGDGESNYSIELRVK